MWLTGLVSFHNAHIANLTQPLLELLSTKRARLWGVQQDAAFDRLKAVLLQPLRCIFDTEYAGYIQS